MLHGQTAAEKICAEEGRPFESLFRYQFVLTENPALGVPGFQRKPVTDTWALLHGPALPVTPVIDAAGRPSGYVLGGALHPEGGLIDTVLPLPASRSDKGFFDACEPLIEGLAGRYAVILAGDAGVRIYVDPVSALGVVFDPKTRAIASSVLLALDRAREPNPAFDEELILAGKGNYTLTHTSDAQVKRLLPNHYLNLTDFTVTRHWPKPDAAFDIPLEQAPGALEEIRDRLARTIGTIAAARPTVMPISAGRDSRNLVACARDHLDKIGEFFAFAHSYNSRIDSAVGSLVAERMNLPYRIYDTDDYPRGALPGRFRQRQITRDWMIANGFTGAPANEVLLGLNTKQPGHQWHIRGNVMDLLQASHWKNGARNPAVHDPRHGIKRLLVTQGDNYSDELVDKWMPDYLEWYESLGPLKSQPYDMIFNELYLASSQGGKSWGYTHQFYISPFNDRYLIDRAISLPLRYRISDKANDDLLAMAAPELSNIPFLRRYQAKAARRGGNWYGKTMVRAGQAA